MNTPRPIPGFPGYTICSKGIIHKQAYTKPAKTGSRHYPARRICHQVRDSGICVTLRDATGKSRFVSVAPLLLEAWGTEPKPQSDAPLYCGKKDSNVHSLELSNLTWLSRGKIKQTANQNGRRR